MASKPKKTKAARLLSPSFASVPALLRIRTGLYPDWDSRGEWVVRYARMKGKHFGHTDHQRKVIWLRRETEIGELGYIDLLAHAAAGSASHGAKWKEQMLDAAGNAGLRGNAGLATEIRKFVNQFLGTRGFTTAEVLDEDAKSLAHLAHAHGGQSPDGGSRLEILWTDEG